MNVISRVCVYCASSMQIDQKYFEATEVLGNELAAAGITVVYGGGKRGLMGKLADTVLAAGGQVVGIIPHFMKEVEWEHQSLTELHLVADMHERKKRFLIGVDALITLPGGCGTFEELMEAITLKRLGLFTRPIIILNQDGYYNDLIAMLNKSVEEHFMREEHRAIWSVVEKPEDILPAITNATPWDDGAIKFAAV